ncbi:DNA replication terminus site-binding protein [Halomonas sp. I5-271120]|uniref:DNA replication terminus site-binding protein n=1 Tax=Halomonas sp. I5-271120 TaxID=3061632 RepID=UPI0027145D6D|nr:DNA replication terminus site-binding protein [Halomonas sp. I5-271120]
MKQYQVIFELERIFDSVVDRVEKLAQLIREFQGDAWALRESTPDHAWAKSALTDFWYSDGQDGRTTRPYIGLVAANHLIIEQVKAVNEAKDAFRKAAAILQEYDKTLVSEIKASLPSRHAHLHENLSGAGLARLHLKQTWRHIPYFEPTLSRVKMAWYTSGRSIKRLSVSDAEKLLMNYDTDSDHIRIQLSKLAGLPSGEMLAQVQTQAPVMRANLFLEEPMDDGRLRKAMNLPLPLFVLSPSGKLPDHNEPPPYPPEKRSRSVRSDNRIEDDPYLPSIRAHRYAS